MALIPISRGLFALIDDADVELVSAYRWFASPRAASNGGYYVGRRSEGTTHYLHRLLLNPPSDLCVDHINGDGLDNRRANLRLATHQQNCANKYVVNPTGFRGVHRRNNRFRASIGSRETLWRGSFCSSAEEAARQYDRMAIERYGEFARLNFPDEHAGFAS